MAIIKKSEIKKMNNVEAEQRVKDLKLELLKIKSQKATQSSAGTKKAKEIKKTVARIKTLINRKTDKINTK
jgi:large subunit ribosomal protein L29